MAVFVDNARNPFGSMFMCHMAADTTRELVEMADRIGVARHHIQRRGTDREHFDVCATKRAAAVACGAVEVSARWLAKQRFSCGALSRAFAGDRAADLFAACPEILGAGPFCVDGQPGRDERCR